VPALYPLRRRQAFGKAGARAGLCRRRRDPARLKCEDRSAKGSMMDLKLVREEAIEATARAFWDRNGFVPDQDSEEWEAEYRRQFEQAKRRQAAGRPAPSKEPAAPLQEDGWAELSGAPTQIRWGAAIRADRLKEIRNPGIRDWLATTWTKARSWVDTRDLPT